METEGLELAAHQPVIEPVSMLESGTGDHRCISDITRRQHHYREGPHPDSRSAVFDDLVHPGLKRSRHVDLKRLPVERLIIFFKVVDRYYRQIGSKLEGAATDLLRLALNCHQASDFCLAIPSKNKHR